MSIIDVYNGKVCDLQNKRTEVKIKGTSKKGFYVDAIKAKVETMKEVDGILYQAVQARKLSKTIMNDCSLRSHLIIRFFITTTDPDSNKENLSEGTVDAREAVLAFVDLAGSEAVGKAGATGEFRNEGIRINNR